MTEREFNDKNAYTVDEPEIGVIDATGLVMSSATCGLIGGAICGWVIRGCLRLAFGRED